jgi:hypothetical protein
MAIATKCAHAECGCQTVDEFCSDFCREHGGEAHEHRATDAGCGCGHPDCVAGTVGV